MNFSNIKLSRKIDYMNQKVYANVSTNQSKQWHKSVNSFAKEMKVLILF